MNRFARAAAVVPLGAVKILWTKLFHFKGFHMAPPFMVSPFSEITIDRGACLEIGKNFKMRDGAKIRVRKNAHIIIGRNSSLNTNNIITCREKITLGDNVQLSPNVQIYDHDHDFRTSGGIAAGKYITSPVKIGNNVWIGANAVILRGTQLGDNCVVGAGCVVQGEYEDNCIISRRTESNSVCKI